MKDKIEKAVKTFDNMLGTNLNVSNDTMEAVRLVRKELPALLFTLTQEAKSEERERCKGIVANYLVLNDKGEKNDPDVGKNDVLLEAIEDIDDPKQMPIDDNGEYMTPPTELSTPNN